jgi:hypothetical protein
MLNLRDLARGNYSGTAMPAPEHPVSASALAELFEDDHIAIEDVSTAAANVRLGALRRSFLDQLAKVELPAFDGSAPFAIKDLGRDGIDTVWGTQHIHITPENGIPYVTSFVFSEEPQSDLIDITARRIETRGNFRFPLLGQENESWYLLRKLDEYPGIRPLFVSRMALGPFETSRNTYGDGITRRLKTVRDVVKDEPRKGVLQCSHLYAFSPNTIRKAEGGNIMAEQELTPGEERDELLVAPAGVSKELSTRLLGQRVRVYEY